MRALGRAGRRWKDIIRMDLGEIGRKSGELDASGS